MYRHRLSAIVAGLGLWLPPSGALAQSTINFSFPGTADWNTAANWDPVFIPGDGFPGEQVGISNGETVVLDEMAQFPVLGLLLGETGQYPENDPAEDGSLLINDTSPGGGVTLMVTGAANVGVDGRGVLDIRAGLVEFGSLQVAGARGPDGSALLLRGNAVLNVSGDSGLSRITRISGPDVTFLVEGNVALSGDFQSVITAATHSPLVATAAVNIDPSATGANLSLSFEGFSPNVGDSWTLVEGAMVNGVFSSVQASGSALPRGTAVEVAYNQGGGANVVASLTNRLILSVDRRTGAARIENAVGDAITIEAYGVLSDGGLLTPDNWNSLEDSGAGGPGWREANPTANHLDELNLTDSLSVAASQSVAIGDPYVAGPVAPADEDLVFEYATADGQVFQGIVEYIGPVNDLVLRVDPTSGAAALQNFSSFVDFELTGYGVLSPSGSLLPDGWNSFEDSGLAGPGWQEANPATEHLDELNLTSHTLFNENTFLEIGNIFDTGGTRDLILQFATLDGQVRTGTVEYGELTAPPDCIEGDTFPCDQTVNIDDLNAVRNAFGTGDGSDTSGISGDTFPFDGFVNIDDLNAVRNNFGIAAAASPVPEPNTCLLLAAATLAVLYVRVR